MNPNWENLIENSKEQISRSNEKSILTRNDNRKIEGVIISAGVSSRMGKFKPLLKYHGETFLVGIINKLLKICNNVIVVTGFKFQKIESIVSENELNFKGRVKCIHNSSYEKGMFSSIVTGLKVIEEDSWTLYHLIDQPNLPVKFYEEFISQIDNSFDWIQPTFEAQKGHPILINKKVIKKILNSEIESNLRIISASDEIRKKYWDCGFSEILTDLDFPEDYKKISE